MEGMPLQLGLGCLVVVFIQVLVAIYMKRVKGTQWPAYLIGFFNGGLFTYIFAVVEPDKPEVEYFGPKVRTLFGLFSFKDVPHPEGLPPQLVTIIVWALIVMAAYLTIAFLTSQWPFKKNAAMGGGRGGGNPGGNPNMR